MTHEQARDLGLPEPGGSAWQIGELQREWIAQEHERDHHRGRARRLRKRNADVATAASLRDATQRLGERERRERSESMDEPTRRTWSRPELIVLVRSGPDEVVLTVCKTATGIERGPAAADQGCVYDEGSPCAAPILS